MAQVHKDIHLTPEDIVLIKAYMDRFVGIGLSRDKPVITNLILFIIASILFLFSIVDAIITKILKRRWINYVILLVTGIFITQFLYSVPLTLVGQRIILRCSLSNFHMQFTPGRMELTVFTAIVQRHIVNLQEFLL